MTLCIMKVYTKQLIDTKPFFPWEQLFTITINGVRSDSVE